MLVLSHYDFVNLKTHLEKINRIKKFNEFFFINFEERDHICYYISSWNVVKYVILENNLFKIQIYAKVANDKLHSHFFVCF